MKNKFAKISSVSFAFMLVVSMVSFGYILGSEVSLVSGDEITFRSTGLMDGQGNVWLEGSDGNYYKTGNGKSLMALSNGNIFSVTKGFYDSFDSLGAESVAFNSILKKGVSFTPEGGSSIPSPNPADARFSGGAGSGSASASGSGSLSCLTPQTQISLSNLQTKSISEIQIGEEVLSYDFESGKLTKEIVRDVIVSQKSEYLVVNGILEITPNHEVLLNGNWKPIGEARVGDYLVGLNGEVVIIDSIEKIVLENEIDVYDLDLGGKWYFAEGVLVHNSDGAVKIAVEDKSASKEPSGAPTPPSKGFFGRVYDSLFDRGAVNVNLSNLNAKETKTALGIDLAAIYENSTGKNLYILYDKETEKATDVWEVVTGDDGNSVAIKTDTQVKHLFGSSKSYFGAAYLLQGLQWAGIAYTAMGMIGGLFMDDNPEKVKAFQKALFSGIMAASAVRGLVADGGALVKSVPDTKAVQWLNKNQAGLSFGVGALVTWMTYNSQYKKETTRTETVSFQCMPWQAPRGGDDCRLCNDGIVPCSEYRCKSLGQACGMVDDFCVNLFVNDASPPKIEPWQEALTEGFRYEGKNLAGVEIKNSIGLDTCIPAFSPLEFGITTDEPSQCKIDVEKKSNYDDMTTYFGGDPKFKKEHKEYISLPKAKDLADSSIKLEVGNKMNLYVMCIDALGNKNEVPYEIKFCVDSADDQTPPEIKATSIESGSCISSDKDSALVDFYTNEPAECRWSLDDRSYESMTNNMLCSTDIYQINSMMLYSCKANLTSVAKDGNSYYVKCKDKPNGPEENRISNIESFVFNLRGSNELKLLSFTPNGSIQGGTSPMRMELRAETKFGCDSGFAMCFFSPTNNDNDYVLFAETGKQGGIHTQKLDLPGGEHTYFVKCVDGGGNIVSGNTTFNVEVFNEAPSVVRAFFKDDFFVLFTDRNSDCVYSTEGCDFSFDEGQRLAYQNSLEHSLPWESSKEYFIKCRDEFKNEPVDCSIKVKTRDNLFY